MYVSTYQAQDWEQICFQFQHDYGRIFGKSKMSLHPTKESGGYHLSRPVLSFNDYRRIFEKSKMSLHPTKESGGYHLSNDVYDFDTGADKNKKESVVNLFGSWTGTHFFAWLLLVLGFIGLSWVSVEAGSLRYLFLLACAIFCGYIYQCPPFRLSYLGVGEPLCFASFGSFATTAFYSLQSGTRELSISGTVIASSILVGFTTSLILFCSHFHQIEDDKALGKFSPLAWNRRRCKCS
ncbi:hypothetical protein ACS0TY_014260 [Phlomoides rotata]